MVDKEEVGRVINDLRASLKMHGGDMKLIEVTDDGVVKVELQGACKGCPMATITIRQGVEARLKEEVPDVKEVVAV